MKKAQPANPPTLPRAYTRMRSTYPDVAEAYDRLGAACAAAGPLDERTRALVKFALSLGSRMEGAAHAHIRKALEARVTPDELRHVALLAVPTIGFPNAVMATTWIRDVVDDLVPSHE